MPGRMANFKIVDNVETIVTGAIILSSWYFLLHIDLVQTFVSPCWQNI